MVLAVVSAIGGMALAPAYADNDNRGGHRDNGKHKGDYRGERGREYQPVYRPVYRPVYQQPYYTQPVYAPPPVYYAPQQSPGISFFFPLDIRGR